MEKWSKIYILTNLSVTYKVESLLYLRQADLRRYLLKSDLIRISLINLNTYL